MADQKPNTIFGDEGTGPIRPDEKPRQPNQAADDSDDLKVNDEGTERGGLRGDRSERSSTADDMSNPRTGPIG